MPYDLALKLIKLYHPRIWIEHWWYTEEECVRSFGCASHEAHKDGYIYLFDAKGSPFWMAITSHQIEAIGPHPDLAFKHKNYQMSTEPPSEWRIWKWGVNEPNSFANLKTIIESYIEARCASTQ